MSRRSIPQKAIDERTFPVRILLRDPGGGWLQALGPGRDPVMWLQQHLGRGNAALHGYRAPEVGNAYALYCRSLDDAARFLRAFPEFELADGVAG